MLLPLIKELTLDFEIYPAIDLRGGRVVRLQYGDPELQTVFSDDPLAIARKWTDAGSKWLHVVNLDGAFDEAGTANWRILPGLARTGAKVQFGGGIRTLKDVERALDTGINRVIFGTVAIENPHLVADAVRLFGSERVVAGIDARDGKVKTRGWQTATQISPAQLGRQMKSVGVQTIIYTDISRDGVLTGVNVSATAQLAKDTGMAVIASGGVATMEDVVQCSAAASNGVAGVVVGRALYDGRIDLQKAIETIRK